MERADLAVAKDAPILEPLETRLLPSTTHVAADAIIDDNRARPPEAIQPAHADPDAGEETILLHGGTLERDRLGPGKAAPTGPTLNPSQRPWPAKARERARGYWQMGYPLPSRRRIAGLGRNQGLQ